MESPSLDTFKRCLGEAHGSVLELDEVMVGLNNPKGLFQQK